MARWQLWQINARLDTGLVQRDPIRVVDDTVEPLTDGILGLFGLDERDNVQVSTPTADTVVAKIQYSPEQRVGWARDREVTYDYIVTFEAIRLPEG